MSANTSPESGARKNDVYEIVTNKIIAQLEKGVVPWHKPWTDAGQPRNLISKKVYRGINLLLLNSLGYEKNFFLTAKQMKEIGASILPEEKPHIVIFWNFADNEQEDEGKDEKKRPGKSPFLRYYTVYNVAQCAGISPESLPEQVVRELEPIPMCEQVVANMPQAPKILFKDPAAYYDPRLDVVNMPKQKTFESIESYYSTLFHELVHSTGHYSRLNRMGLAQMSEFGSILYSQEELVAEIGTCFLQSFAGIPGQFEQSAAYIQSWLKVLKNDKRFVVMASALSQKATDFILNVQSEGEEKQGEE